MTMLKKLMPVEVKELGDRVLEIAGSTEDVDRMGDVIKAKGWKLGPFKKNPVFLWAHDYSQPPIGRALKVWIDKETKKLMFQVEFADAETYAFADTIYKLYKGGFLHATSVGFIPLNWEGKSDEEPYPKWEDNVYTEQELLELSGVPVPANANALVNAREQGLITVKEFTALTLEPEVKPLVVSDNDAPGGEVELSRVKQCPQCYLHFPEAEFEGHDLCKYCGGVKEETPEPTALATQEPPQEREVTQEQLRDDIDYMHKAIILVGMNEETKLLALGMAWEIIQRVAGNDIPDDIVAKVGAVLNAKNKGRLSKIQELAQEVLDSAKAGEDAETDDSDKQLEPLEAELCPADKAKEVAEVVALVIAKLKGKRIY